MNDERPIEKLLRRYAQKRRDEGGEPPVLHPATRRLLQGEVARQFPQAAKGSVPPAENFFSVFARRWIYAVGVLVVIGVSAAMLLPTLKKSGERNLLAKKTPEKTVLTEAEALPPAAPAVLSATEPLPSLATVESRNQSVRGPSGGGNLVLVRDGDSLSYTVTNGIAPLARRSDSGARERNEASRPATDRLRMQPGERRLTPAPTSVPPSGARPTDSLALAESAPTRQAPALRSDRFADSIPATAPSIATTAPGTAPADQSLIARGGGEKDASQRYSQSFANVSAEQFTAKAESLQAAAPAPTVLANFQVENEGNQVRVVDSDGSTYFGVINPAVVAQLGTDLKKTDPATFQNTNLGKPQTTDGNTVANQGATPEYQYQVRVEGTNRTYNQNVVFTFNFVDTNALAAAQLKAFNARNQDLKQLPSQMPALLQNSFINGRAQLGPAQQIEINAVPVPLK